MSYSTRTNIVIVEMKPNNAPRNLRYIRNPNGLELIAGEDYLNAGQFPCVVVVAWRNPGANQKVWVLGTLDTSFGISTGNLDEYLGEKAPEIVESDAEIIPLDSDHAVYAGVFVEELRDANYTRSELDEFGYAVGGSFGLSEDVQNLILTPISEFKHTSELGCEKK